MVACLRLGGGSTGLRAPNSDSTLCHLLWLAQWGQPGKARQSSCAHIRRVRHRDLGGQHQIGPTTTFELVYCTTYDSSVFLMCRLQVPANRSITTHLEARLHSGLVRALGLKKKHDTRALFGHLFRLGHRILCFVRGSLTKRKPGGGAAVVGVEAAA